VLLGGFVLLAAATGLTLAGGGRSARVAGVLTRLQDTTAEIRVRGAVLLLVGFLALAQHLGLEVILGAFVAGAVLKVVDRDVMRTHPHFHLKLEAIGYGMVIPVFFVSSGMRFDLASLLEGPATLARVPLFLLAILAARGLPALLYRPVVGMRRSVAAGLLQATTLPFVVAAGEIGMELGVLTRANGAALVAAGLFSVLVFPVAALTVLRGRARSPAPRIKPALP
jgi:Kef-type K+ transport system membrane component KefB